MQCSVPLRALASATPPPPRRHPAATARAGLDGGKEKPERNDVPSLGDSCFHFMETRVLRVEKKILPLRPWDSVVVHVAADMLAAAETGPSFERVSPWGPSSRTWRGSASAS